MDSEPVIRVEGLGKRYTLGASKNDGRYTALRDVLAEKAISWFRRPFNRRADADAPPAETDFWALRDVSFDVRRGEVVGIIGRNGAGKSTLLKILSRITEPTEGTIKLRGRVASLLEVGTGFHPELTGRENIFLNGAILGMHRAEIKAKFDEIVAFAEVERFLDTPVKRYSSGMYVRLAFAVAAHLEPEILIVDEVLAVGDAEFQKRCLGKLQAVANQEGRTVLFVSHNMAAISSLTQTCLVLCSGQATSWGPTSAAIAAYVALTAAGKTTVSGSWGRGPHTRINSARLLNETGATSSNYTPGDKLHVEIEFETDGFPGLSLELFLKDENQAALGLASAHQFHGLSLPTTAGSYRCCFELVPMWLASGRYTMGVSSSVVNSAWDHVISEAFDFEVAFSNPTGLSWDFRHSLGYGAIAMLCSGPIRFHNLVG